MKKFLFTSSVISSFGRLSDSKRFLGNNEKKDELSSISDATIKQSEVDPFRVGYNMGMQSVHLEAIRMKLTDHLELFKSHFHALTDILKSNHEQVTQLHNQYNKGVSQEIKESNNQFLVHLSTIDRQLKIIEDSIKSIMDDRIHGLQRHIDDCFENLKDTIKLGFAVILFLNLWMFYTISQNHRQYMNSRTSQTFSENPSRVQK